MSLQNQSDLTHHTKDLYHPMNLIRLMQETAGQVPGAGINPVPSSGAGLMHSAAGAIHALPTYGGAIVGLPSSGGMLNHTRAVDYTRVTQPPEGSGPERRDRENYSDKLVKDLKKKIIDI